MCKYLQAKYSCGCYEDHLHDGCRITPYCGSRWVIEVKICAYMCPQCKKNGDKRAKLMEWVKEVDGEEFEDKEDKKEMEWVKIKRRELYWERQWEEKERKRKNKEMGVEEPESEPEPESDPAAGTINDDDLPPLPKDWKPTRIKKTPEREAMEKLERDKWGKRYVDFYTRTLMWDCRCVCAPGLPKKGWPRRGQTDPNSDADDAPTPNAPANCEDTEKKVE